MISSENCDIVASAQSTGHSADVRIELRVGKQHIPVAQAGGNQLIFREPVMLHDSTGELLMHIDGFEQRWTVDIQGMKEPAYRAYASLSNFRSIGIAGSESDL